MTWTTATHHAFQDDVRSYGEQKSASQAQDSLDLTGNALSFRDLRDLDLVQNHQRY